MKLISLFAGGGARYRDGSQASCQENELSQQCEVSIHGDQEVSVEDSDHHRLENIYIVDFKIIFIIL